MVDIFRDHEILQNEIGESNYGVLLYSESEDCYLLCDNRESFSGIS